MLQVAMSFNDEYFLSISEIISTHFKPLLYDELKREIKCSFVLDHLIVTGYFRYQSSTRVPDMIFDRVLRGSSKTLDSHSPTRSRSLTWRRKLESPGVQSRRLKSLSSSVDVQ